MTSTDLVTCDQTFVFTYITTAISRVVTALPSTAVDSTRPQRKRATKEHMEARARE